MKRKQNKQKQPSIVATVLVGLMAMYMGVMGEYCLFEMLDQRQNAAFEKTLKEFTSNKEDYYYDLHIRRQFMLYDQCDSLVERHYKTKARALGCASFRSFEEALKIK